MAKKKILITGVTGFVGSHLADYLVENTSYEVFGLKRVNSSMRNIHQLRNKIKLFDGDLIDQTSLYHVIKEVMPDQIYHLGALSWVTPSWTQPSAYMQINAVGTINLLEAMRMLQNKARVFISATPEEFGDVPAHMIPITEETRMEPINPYACSKAAQDMICYTYFKSYGMDIVRTRAFNHEGPRRDIHGAIASFAFQIAQIERNLIPPVISVGNLEATRNFTDIRDTVKAYFLAMEKGVAGELYLIGTDQVFTMKECLEKLIGLSQKSEMITYQVDPGRVRPTELRTFIGKFDKFTKLTGWKQTVNLEDTLKSVLNYWRDFLDKDKY